MDAQNKVSIELGEKVKHLKYFEFEMKMQRNIDSVELIITAQANLLTM